MCDSPPHIPSVRPAPKPYPLSPYRGISSIRNAPPKEPAVGLFLGPYGSPKGWAVSYERGASVGFRV